MGRSTTQLLMLLLRLFIVTLGFGIVIPTLPFLARRVGTSPIEMGLLWAFTASTMFSTLGYSFVDRARGNPSQLGLAFTLMGLASSVIQFGVIGHAIRMWGEERCANRIA